MAYARYGQSPIQTKTTGEKQRKVRSANRRPEQRGGGGGGGGEVVSLLNLDTGEELPINAPS